ncbi:MAG: NAD(P)H-quinone oxidoreductase [Anaerolinea sp.]|nr:NAD(P)H-quinone oxidoreductase [Anaerolinea sp.]CAG1014739.1 Phthiocerol synthesis polyketide synthase type I PpsC [Anaerolineae bacterium]
MKAILFDAPGDPSVLYYGDTPDPQPGEGELLVRIRATALNRADLLQRRGGYAPPAGASSILGLELAGEVEIGAGEFKPGDRVMAVVTGGGYAQKAVVPAGMAIRVPGWMGFEEAAAIPEAYLTAYLNLFTLGELRPNETVLIHAGASGVGTAAIQLAFTAGAQVLTTAGSIDKCKFCRDLGAAAAFDYHSENIWEQIQIATDDQGVNLILDFVGASNISHNLRSLAVGGRLLLIGFLGGSKGEIDLSPILTKSLTIQGTTLRRTPLDQKVALSRAFESYAMPRFRAGALRAIIDSVYPLSEAAEAHRRMEHNENIGKIVLSVQ